MALRGAKRSHLQRLAGVQGCSEEREEEGADRGDLGRRPSGWVPSNWLASWLGSQLQALSEGQTQPRDSERVCVSIQRG